MGFPANATLPTSSKSRPRAAACPVCDAHDGTLFFERDEMPVHVGVQWPTQEAARQCPKGTMALHYCPQCGHLYNAAFDPALVEYTGAYDNSLHYSPHFRAYTQALAKRLVERYDLRGKHLIEIGCGQGHFLRLLARLGNNWATGFDPSHAPASEEDPEGKEHPARVTFIQAFYSERYAACLADFMCSRYVFEHIPDPMGFLGMVRHAAARNGGPVVYFEVPNAALILRDLSIWDIIYEHCSFFSAPSLAYAFARSGFHVCDLYEAYAGQFLGIEATLRPAPSSLLPAEERWADAREMLREQVRRFRARCADRKATWNQRLLQMRRDGKRVVLWGAGAKAVGFMNLLGGEGAAGIDYVVDLNPNKQGRFLAGSGQQIVPPAFLAEYRPEAVIIMNPVYQNEIQASLNDLGVQADVLCAS